MDSKGDKKKLYQMVIDKLMQKIDDRNFDYDLPICTEKQLAADYHVSNITAKRAINELEQKGILYRKRGVGSFVSQNIPSKNSEILPDATKVFAFILPYTVSPGSVFVDMMEVLNEKLNANHGFVSFYMNENDCIKEREVLERLRGQRISGIIYFPSTNCINLDVLDSYVIQDIPVIILNRLEHAPYLHNVVCDNFGGQRELTKYLISEGHEKIAYMTSDSSKTSLTICERLGGYFCAMKEANLSLYPDFIISNLDEKVSMGLPVSAIKLERVRNHVRFLYSNGVTAIECDNDGLAYYVMQCCDELSIKVPDDISISGFDGYVNIDHPELKITTVYHNFKAIAETASDILLKSMDNKLIQGEKTIIDAHIVIGTTTAAPRK